MKYRLDVFLQLRGFFDSRSRAADALSKGLVEVNGVIVKKPSFMVEDGVIISVLTQKSYISRAYAKLAFALDEFEVNPAGRIAVDIGASTGGFTQCLLERNAKKVYAVDVGRGQLHPSLRKDSRVVNMESVNARYIEKNDFYDELTLAVMDVSFISQSKIYPALSDILIPGGYLISLVKPQFEAGRENIGKNGIVKDKDGRLIERIKQELSITAAEHGLCIKDFADSPVLGGDGNKEYLALFKKEKEWSQ